MSNIKMGDPPIHRNTLECSKEFTGKWAIVSPCQEPTLARDVLPANISLASTSRATNGLPLMNVVGRMEFRKEESHQRSWSGMFSSTCNHNRKASELKKGKEPIIHDVDHDSSSSNRRDNGQESFECISSRRMVSTVKRVMVDDSESEKIVESKRLKRPSDGNCSFMNWVTTLTNRLPRHSKDAPMELFQHPSIPMNGFISPLSISDKEREIIGVSHGIVGFKSIFQSMYQPCYNVHSKKNEYVDHQKQIVVVKGTEREKQDSCAAVITENEYIIPKSLWIARFSHRVSSASPKSISHTDNSDSKLQRTLSSKNCKISEPMTSTFARRLDTLIHTTELNNVEEYTGANMFCLFCGRSDHSIWECSKVVETRLEHYLNTMPLYDRIKKATCFCILCFHLDHWAASCPNVSLKGNDFDDDKSKDTIEKHRNHHFANHGRAVMLFSGIKKDLHQVENKDSHSDFVVGPKVSKNESACCGILDLHMNRVEDATNMDKMKAASFFSQKEAKQARVTPFCSHLSTKIATETEGIFVFIRMLRLSRMDIIRWMKSSARINLTGFFLRLRIEKLEKGLGGTGYYVARINGESCQSSMYVCVGSSTYTVASRFISNQDFTEDELNTWWFQKLRDESQIPSREELNEKLQLRIKFGF
ncbi:hypothetical protein KSP40_PGU000185 [Platanthera guangdongensis]|uniref:Plus3 domain-containing protein n=1 Tax=Platanthera guangdongensis TaxID=2320717 RepID=A0ABR2LVF8_9ASPA